MGQFLRYLYFDQDPLTLLSKTTQAVSKRDLIMGLRAPVKVKKLSVKEKQDEKVLLGHLYEDKVFLR